MKYPERYIRNKILTDEEQRVLGEKTVAVFGVGGLGGYAAEMLARMGVGKIIVLDGDVFSESNLNRQLFSTEKNLGVKKAEAARERLLEVNSEVEVRAVTTVGNYEEIKSQIGDSDAVVDCLDTARDKKSLQRMAKELGIPMIHGAIGGWFGQVMTILPGDDSLDIIYPGEGEPDDSLGNPAFTPAFIAALQVSETIKVLTGREEVRSSELIVCDLLNNEFEKVKL